MGSYDGPTPARCSCTGSATGAPLQVERLECRQTTTPWERPPAHLLRRFLLDRFNHLRLPRVGAARRAPPSILRYYTNKAILWMTVQLPIDLRQPAVAILRRPCVRL